ncbi:embryo-specific protein ATS3B-like [Pyrus x bretschneideri]|uniref:embryo-specific protein ATS3B-like n=1 Tax=Pyrus x bretschneideri TaxID=225117 RepID=UPI000870A2D7|nr:embryo-specific protein ATS3B-like [Pyrus x bretschneideri]
MLFFDSSASRKSSSHSICGKSSNMFGALFLLLQACFLFTLSQAKLSIIRPEAAAKDFNVSKIPNAGTCSYTAIITTSCSSTRYTRDQISISFGDAYGNQIYAPRLDDPSSRTFELCSTDTFDIYGPCAYQICYLYLYRTGPDGWKPEYVKIYGHNSRAVTFTYNTFIPNDLWYGFNWCNAAPSSAQKSAQRWSMFAIAGLIGFLIL